MDPHHQERTNFVSNFTIKTKNLKSNGFFPPTVRIKLTVHEIWVEHYSNRESMEFKNFAENLRSAVSEVYEENEINQSNSIDANLIDVQ